MLRARWRRQGVARAVAPALSLVVTACARESTDHDLAQETPPDTEVTTTTTHSDSLELVWSTESIGFVTQPVVSGEQIVVYAAVDGGLWLLAYDPATGEEAWRRESTASSITRGVAFGVTADDETVFHVVPGPGDAAAVEAVDAATGEPLWRTSDASQGFTDPVDFCGDAERMVCVTAAGGAGQWQLDVETGELPEPIPLRAPRREVSTGVAEAVPPPEGAEGVDGRSLGGDLYELYDSGDIAHVVDGQVLWQKPPSELFGGAAVSPDYGWWFRPATNHITVGTLGAVEEHPAAGSIDLPVQHTAGIDLDTGETSWLTEGDMTCGRLGSLGLRETNSPPWLRCHSAGTMTLEEADVVTYAVGNVVEGFDPVTGETEWSFDLGPSSALLDWDKPLVRLGPHRFGLMRDDNSPVGLDVLTGEAIPVTPEDVGWCFSPNEYDYDGPGGATRVGQSFATPCHLSGQLEAVPVEPDRDVGVVVDDIFVWMDEAGLHGARLPG